MHGNNWEVLESRGNNISGYPITHDVSVNIPGDSYGGYLWSTQTPYESWYGGYTGDGLQFDVVYKGSLSHGAYNLMYIDSYYNDITTYYNNGTPVSSLSDVWINGLDWNKTMSTLFDDSFAVHQSIYSGNDVINCAGVLPLANGIGNTLYGYAGADNITGSNGNDDIHGMAGGDYILGGPGDDIIRGGNGHDLIDGMDGSDWIWGGLGWNIMSRGTDGVKDEIYVPADSTTNSFGNPGGVNADLIRGVDTTDRIYIYGVDDSTLTYVDNVTHPLAGTFVYKAPDLLSTSYAGSYTGVGIYSNGVLEAIVTVDGATSGVVDQFTSGVL